MLGHVVGMDDVKYVNGGRTGARGGLASSIRERRERPDCSAAGYELGGRERRWREKAVKASVA